MKTSLNDVKIIDQYLQDQQSPGDRLITEARLITDAQFREQVSHQRLVLRIIRYFGRKNFKSRLQSVHHRLMMEEDFRKRVSRLFN